MELYYKDELHLIEKGYKKLTNSISEILKGPKKDLHHYPNRTYGQPVMKTNKHFPALPTKFILSTIKVFTHNLTTTTLTPRYEYALLKNIGTAKAKENQMIVTVKNRNEKIKKLAQENQLFLLWEKRTPPPLSTTTTTATTTITLMTRTTPVTVRKTITR